MERKEIVTIELYTPKEVAKRLKINPSTLRKYCGMISKEYGKEYFKRDDSNARLYSDSDIELLKQVMNLKKAPNVSLEKAVKMAMQQIIAPDSKADITSPAMEIGSDKAPAMLALQEVKSIMDRQSDDIAVLLEANQQLMDNNKKLSDNVQRLLDEIQESKQKRSWFSKLLGK